TPAVLTTALPRPAARIPTKLNPWPRQSGADDPTPFARPAIRSQRVFRRLDKHDVAYSDFDRTGHPARFHGHVDRRAWQMAGGDDRHQGDGAPPADGANDPSDGPAPGAAPGYRAAGNG